MIINLKETFFGEKETVFVKEGALNVSLVKYDTGINAVKLSNEHGYITVLPYNGQMIWDAQFHDRRLKMKMPYEYPRDTESFIDTYGCYMMHCGVLGMGGPGPEDDHAPHGELPYAKYDSAWLCMGEDIKGKYIGVSGRYEYNRAFKAHYVTVPEVRLYLGSTVLDIQIDIKNLSTQPMEMMYLCHVNNRSATGGRIVQPLAWTEGNMKFRPNKGAGGEGSIFDRIKADPGLTRQFAEKDIYDPEAVYYLATPMADKDGWTHYMFVNSDGSADYTSYMPKDLNCCTRWIARTREMETLGLALPATADADGYTMEKAKGNIKILASGESFQTVVKAGYLNADEVSAMESKINELV